MKKHFGSVHSGLLNMGPTLLISIPLGVFMFLVMLLAPFSSAVVTENGQADQGRRVFEKRCGGCHALESDREGPRLGGVYGRKAGTVASFRYSDALAKSGITWNEGTLDKWLTDPDRFIPDADMDFHLEKPDERAEVIAYLKQLSSR